MTTLSPELRKRFAAHVGADASATDVTDEALSIAVADEYDATFAEAVKIGTKNKELTDAFTPLSADVERLTAELTAAKAEANDKAQQVLTLSANAPQPPHPLVASMFADTLENRVEAAIEAGVPQAAVNYFANLFKDASGAPTVLALSACAVPTKEAGKTKNSQLAIAIIDGLAKLYKGGFGQAGPGVGVIPGKVGVLTMSGDAQKPAKLSMQEYSETRQLHGMDTTAADYQAYVAR